MRIIKHNTMAINVTLGEVETQEIKSFPKIMKSKSDTVVLFIAEKTGTVIMEKKPVWGIGHYSEDWEMTSFTDYNEPIILQNA